MSAIVACSVCFAAAAGAGSGSGIAIAVLLGATVVVLGGIGAFMIRLARLERLAREVPR